MPKPVYLEAQNLIFAIDNKTILENVSFRVHQGQFVAILGQSGVGKSSLLKILAGQMNPNDGVVLFKGTPLQDPREQLIRGHKEIKLVNQDFDLEWFHNVEENLRIKLPGYVESTKKELIDEVLAIVELTDFAKQQVRFLSGGEQQRLTLARALIQEPDVLLLDEPFVHLDPGLRARIEYFIQNKIKNWKGSVVLVTHDGREAMAWADQIIYLNQGKIERVDTPRKFYEQPRSLKEALHFGQVNVVQDDGLDKMFRPNAYTITQSDGMLLRKVQTKFLGTHFEVLMKNNRNEDILLYSQHELANEITIVPHYVGEK